MLDHMRLIEERIGIRPIEELLAERQQLVENVAELRAKYGPGGTWTHHRKILLAQIAQTVRARAVAHNERITEAAIDEAAHADDRYADFLTRAIEWANLEERIQAITEIINRGQALARFAAAEVATTP